jgi:hypothetical protein
VRCCLVHGFSWVGSTTKTNSNINNSASVGSSVLGWAPEQVWWLLAAALAVWLPRLFWRLMPRDLVVAVLLVEGSAVLLVADLMCSPYAC